MATFRTSSSILPRAQSAVQRHVLRVEVLKATGLAAGDFSFLGRHSSDPYVILTVGKEKFKSEVKPKTLDPVWDDAVYDFHITDGDLFTKVLDVQVFDQDSKEDDLLGTIAIPLAQFSQQSGPVRSKPYHLNVPATYAKQKCTSQIYLNIQLIEAAGGNDNPLTYIPRHLTVHLHKATDLAAADFALLGRGKSDPYVVFSVASQRFKSETINKSLNPVWQNDPSFEFEITQDDLFTQVLDVQVFDSDHGLSADDLIGTLSIPLAQFDVPGEIRPRPYLLNVPDTYRKQNVHSQLYLTIEMDEKPMLHEQQAIPNEAVELIEQMQAEIAALKVSSQSMVHKMEAEINATPPPAPTSSASQPEPEVEDDNRKKALVNELHGLLNLPQIKTFTKLQVASTTDGESLHWKNEVEHLKAQLEQQKRLNEMIAAQDSGDKEEVERLKKEIAIQKATLEATQSMMEEQLRREAQTQEELNVLKTIALRKLSMPLSPASAPEDTTPISPRSKSTGNLHENDAKEDEDDSLWL